jgi:hypothetical protein
LPGQAPVPERAGSGENNRLFSAPASLVPRALRAPSLGSFCAPGHINALTIDEGIGKFAAGFVEVTPHGLAGYPETFCRLFLLKTFKVDEPYQLDLFRLERDPLPLRCMTAGFVTPAFRGRGDHAPRTGPSPAGAFTGIRDFTFSHGLFRV